MTTSIKCNIERSTIMGSIANFTNGLLRFSLIYSRIRNNIITMAIANNFFNKEMCYIKSIVFIMGNIYY